MTLLPGRLNNRMILLVSIVLCITGILSGWVTATRHSDRLITEMREHSSVMVKHFAENCARYLILQDYSELEAFLLKSAELPNVISLQVCEPDGRIVGDVIRRSDGNLVSKSGIRQTRPPATTVPSHVITGDIMTFWYPISAGSRLGWIKAEFSLASIKQAQVATWTQSLILALLWIIGSAAMIFIVLRPTAVALDKLAQFARELHECKGNLIQVEHDAIEIETLEKSLNYASTELIADITERKEAELQLHASEQAFRAVVENSPDVIVRYDREGRRIYVNPEFERVNNLTSEQVLGKSPIELSTELSPMAVAFTEKLMEAMDSGIVTKIDLSWTKEGNPICWYVRVVPEFDANGTVISALTIWSDISERKQTEEQLKVLNEKLDQRVQERTAELEAKNSELARLNKIFVGRELRMIELKERIRELENGK
ncbi:aerobic respiration control sensor protein ArcB [Geobacter sp. OR-1]|uniref:PAS domain S-box protein n=1 Tax=Geobacter sp. OR-1 TaxID=1266765 RepID=UPI000541A5D2|nr:PAS domain S-box protein [Geobacter sp. OR-1]GAM10794.1 aerobic respiration control sensor protein ArcB [Geobacter sp. OR-1]